MGICVPVAIVACMGASGRASAQVSDKQAVEWGEHSRLYALPLLKNPLFVDLDWSLPVSWRTTEFAKVLLPSEKIEHREGVFRIVNVNSVVYNTEPLMMGVYSDFQLRVLGSETVFDRKHCEGKALSFLAIAFPWYFKEGALPIPTVVLSGNGIYNFKWRRYGKDEMPTSTIYAGVRSIDGRVVSFTASQFSGPWERKVSPAQAKEIAIRVAQKGTTMHNVKVGDWNPSGGIGNFYEITLQAQKKNTNQTYTTSVTVDAANGKPYSNAGWRPTSLSMHINVPVKDRLPVWANQNLSFVSSREIQNTPEWAQVPPQLYFQDQAGKLFYVTSDLLQSESQSLSFLSARKGSNWATFGRNGWSYALNSKTGDYRVLGEPERPASSPTLSNDAQWAILSAKGHMGNRDADLFADSLERKPELALRARLILPGSNEYNPLFSPDDKWLYFLRIRFIKDDAIQTLCRLPAAEVKVRDAKKLDETKIETIATIAKDIERMSIFPDGKRLLLQMLDGILIVDVAQKKVTPVKFPKLTDVEVGARITGIIDGWAGPTDDRITFSGQTTGKDGKVRRRIYSCRTDGTSLKAHTPKENTPVPMYKFPDGDKTAYDLAKTWALAEIKYEDAHKERRY